MPEKVFVFHDVKGQDDSLVPRGVDNPVAQNSEHLIVRKIFLAGTFLSAIKLFINQGLVDGFNNVFWDHHRATATRRLNSL